MKLKKSGIQAHKQAIKILSNWFDNQTLIKMLVEKAGGVTVLDKSWAHSKQNTSEPKLLYASWDKEGGLTLWLDKPYE